MGFLVSARVFLTLGFLLLLGILISCFLVILGCSSLGLPAAALYAAWVYVDWNTPYTEGRSSRWVRKNSFWSCLRKYFPQRLVTTADLPPENNYLFCLFPHAIFSTAAFCHFFSQNSDLFRRFPWLKVTPVTLSINFCVPFVREILLAAGACSCAEESILYKLTKPSGGNGVLLVPGGSAEALVTESGAYNLVLKDRKGFIRLAHMSGAHIVPALAFGESDVYGQINFPRSSAAYKIQEWIRKVTGIAPCLFYGRSALFPCLPGIFPKKRPVTTVLGEPIPMTKMSSPSQEIIDKSHEEFIKALTELFEKHKKKYIKNHESVHLNIM